MSDTLDKLPLLDLARECGADECFGNDIDDQEKAVIVTESVLAAFAERIRADQRERDAALCEGRLASLDEAAKQLAPGEYGAKCCVEGRKQQARADAAAIRSSGEQGESN